MARVKLIIDKTELTNKVNEVEASNGGAFATLTLLHEAVAATDWAKNHQPKAVSASVVGLRIKEFEIEPITKPGKRGRSDGFGGRPAGPRTSRKDKINTPVNNAIFDKLLEQAPDSFHKTIERARNGSLTAAIKVNCAQCVGFEHISAFVGGCSTKDCSLYPFRPYQTVTKDGQRIDEDIDEDEVIEVESETTTVE